MDNRQELEDFLNNGHREFRPHLSIDCAIFGFHEGELKILLVKNLGLAEWYLPGGFVKKWETLNEAAARIAEQRTGMSNLFLKQFKTFGDPGRNKSMMAALIQFCRDNGLRLQPNTWLDGETVSVGFYAIADILNATPALGNTSHEIQWFAADQLPDMGFDHKEMIAEALATMRMHLYHFPVGKNLLPPLFTLKEIKQFYEVMSGKTLHSTHFPNKLISLGLILKTNEKRSIGAHRSPTYYRFDEAAYEKALQEGLVLV